MFSEHPGLCVFAYEYFIFLGSVTSPYKKPPFLGDQFVSLSLASLLRSIRLGSRYQEHKVPSGLARFLRSVKGYTKLDKIRSEVIRKELEISGMQDVRYKHKQNWINRLERMDNTRFLRHAPTTNLEEQGIVDALGNDGNASMPEQVNRPNPWRKMMMMT